MDAAHVVAGALTGLVVGMTGVGGGALIAPVLLLVFEVPPLRTVGTDLWFAALTKLAVSALHIRSRLIDWTIVFRLWSGSLPASLLTATWLAGRPAGEAAAGFIHAAIGVAILMTAVGLLVQDKLRGSGAVTGPADRRTLGLTVAVGAVLGLLVTLTSIGAGALGAVFLYRVYADRLSAIRLVATDIAHAIPLALCAGIGHLAMSHVDVALLRDLLVGSVPSALIGAAVSTRIPHLWVARVLGTVLLAVGLLLLAEALI